MAEALSSGRAPTPRQTLLAEVLLRGGFDSQTEALLAARYSPKTARSDSKDIRERPGVQRALAVLKKRQSDKASGIQALRDAALVNGKDDLTALDPRDRLGFALQATKTLAECPVEETPDDGAAERARATIARAFELGRRWQASRNKRPNTCTFAPETGIDNQCESLQVIDAVAVESDNG